MMITYSLSSSNILEDKKSKILIIEASEMLSPYYSIIMEQYERIENVSEYICKFKNNSLKQEVLIAFINDSMDSNCYLSILSTYITSVYEKFGRRISIFLPSISHFQSLANSAAEFCINSMSWNHILSFHSDQSNLEDLKQAFFKVDCKIQERKLELAESFLSAFQCFVCKSLAYSPHVFECCGKLLCKSCNSSRDHCPICKRPIKGEELVQCSKLFSKFPYYCFCKSKFIYEDREEHSKICMMNWYNCKFCNKELPYALGLSHLKQYHLLNLMQENLF